MTRTEMRVEIELDQAGWVVLRGGWPDFMCYREDGPEIKAVEVKMNGQNLTYTQRKVRECLIKSGVKVEVIHCAGTGDSIPVAFGLDEHTYSILQERARSEERGVLEIVREILIEATLPQSKEK